MEEEAVTLVQRREVFAGNIFDVHVDKIRWGTEEAAVREVVRHPGAVAIIAYDSQRGLCLVKQYRYPLEEWVLEIPAGRKEPNESPVFCAQRELEEETGFTAKEFQPLFSLHSSPGFTDERIWMIRAKGLEECSDPRQGDEKRIDTVWLDLDEAQKMLCKGRLSDAKTVVALLYLSSCRSTGGVSLD